MSTQIGQRLVFENAKTLINQLGYDTSHAVLTPSYLRSEVALSTTAATYHVPVLVNDNQNGTPTLREQRLSLQDLFIVSGVQITLVSGTGANAKSYTYPSLESFASEQPGLYTLYNGYLNIQVNNQNVLPKWSLLQHLNVPQTQYAFGVVPDPTTFDQVAFDSYALQVCEPNIVLNGASNIQASIILPAAPLAMTPMQPIYISVNWYGILAQNCTSVK